MKTGRPGGNQIKSTSQKSNLPDKINSVSPMMAFDLASNMIKLGSNVVDLLKEKERTKQVYIESAARVEEARLHFEEEQLRFQNKMAELKNSHDQIQDRSKVIEASIRYCDIYIEKLTFLMDISLSGNNQEIFEFQNQISNLILLFNNAHSQLVEISKPAQFKEQ